ncbi:hypothetical protein RA262_27705, partial [Pseudomonas syringae pv. tagetis]
VVIFGRVCCWMLFFGGCFLWCLLGLVFFLLGVFVFVGFGGCCVVLVFGFVLGGCVVVGWVCLGVGFCGVGVCFWGGVCVFWGLGLVVGVGGWCGGVG